jgi:hypothetical protein
MFYRDISWAGHGPQLCPLGQTYLANPAAAPRTPDDLRALAGPVGNVYLKQVA